jgi:hypothetical protein
MSGKPGEQKRNMACGKLAFLYCSHRGFAPEGPMTFEEAGFDKPVAACLPFRTQRSFAETAASIRRAFDELRAAEDALERQLADIRAHIDACGLPHVVAEPRAA